MKLKNIASPAIVGTSAMTLYSYVMSHKAENYREPEMLAILLRRLPLNINCPQSSIASWVSHYAVGFLFSSIYVKLFTDCKLKPSVFNGLSLGAISGGFGILIWKLNFKLHPDPPSKNLRKYFRHLFNVSGI